MVKSRVRPLSGSVRPTTVRLGAVAEARAITALIDAGYHIVTRNFRCRLGELDVVARHGDALVFVEVRSRASARFGFAAESVQARKQRQVARVAEVYLAAHRPQFRACRFDVVDITGGAPIILRDAWRLG